ncbi:plasmid pRiA4b ORF-3 family protein [Variovorax humicola]|uniref:Plasmid pRiA4b ORF-3 family protein n=1 Tax=Variovorax humicola TaxID=1769758 RepID=A0ABU8WA17_9BURK
MGQEVLQLRVVLRSISPLIWRRLLVRSDTSIARLHQILQVAFGWQDMHLHRFEIRGRPYGIHQDGGAFFDTNAHEALIGQLMLRRLERFTYEYDFGDGWLHDLRIEVTSLIDPKRVYPVCIAGRRAAPPEDCGGPHAFMANRSRFALMGESLSRAHLDLDGLADEVDDEDCDILSHYHPERFDRRAINRRLAALAPPSKERAADEGHRSDPY